MTTQSTDSLRTFNDIYLANLTYKCLSKMTVWVWQRIEKDKASAEGLNVHEPWVNCLVLPTSSLIFHGQDKTTVSRFGFTAKATY